MNKRKKMILMISMLALSTMLFGILIFSEKPKQSAESVSLRSTAQDLTINDMLSRNATSSSPSSSQEEGIVTTGIQPTSVDNAEDIQHVQELIRSSQQNIDNGKQMIANDKNKVYTPDYRDNNSSPTPIFKTHKKEYKKDTLAVEKTRSVFHSVSFGSAQSRNAIKAYVHSDQIVMEGSTLKMRLAEDCVTDNGITIPKSSPVFGEVKSINGERVMVDIKYINYNGNILPFKKKVYSRDALAGIYAPGNAKSEINKDVTEGAVDGLPSGVALDPSLQLATTIANSAVSAGKGAVSKATRKLKVLIKTNYELYLRPDQN